MTSQDLPAFPALRPDAHKGSAGRVLCVAGSRTMPGAAILVARAAQRAGAGLVCLGALDPELLAIVPMAAPEAVLLDLSHDFRPDGSRSAASVQRLLDREPHARLIGPGIGDDQRARALLGAALEDASVPLVLDADALNALDGEPERLVPGAQGVRILTPHPGEAERLAGQQVPRSPEGRSDFAADLASRTGSIVCLKGKGTVVSDGERTWTNTTGNSGMATAGAGDVLAGMLVAYLARPGSDPFDACRWAVFVHGLAGDLAAEERGERAVIASDLIASLGAAQMRSGIDERS